MLSQCAMRDAPFEVDLGGVWVRSVGSVRAASERTLPGCPGCGGRSYARQSGAAAPDHREEGCRWRSCPEFSPDRRGCGPSSRTRPCAGTASVRSQSIGATRCHTVQEPDRRRALPAWFHQPGHPLTADIGTLAGLVRRLSEEGKCQSQPLFSAATCPRPDRQDSTHASLARDPPRLKRHGHYAVPARALLTQYLLRRRALIVFAKTKNSRRKHLSAAVVEYAPR